MKPIQLFLVLSILFFVTACSRISETYSRKTSYALTSYRSTDIGRIIEREVARHPGKSGFDLIRYGREAFTARIAMTDLTDRTLDLQYYLWDQDETGRLLAYQTLLVADRGVKVRVLLDDIGLQGRDSMIAAMDAHPNIEIRIFNPFSSRGLHAIDFLADTERINHRMHNKTVIMDNVFAIVGGRNIGNHYFGVSDEINFRDLDIAAVGPVVRDISKMYDYFWNGKWAVPISAIVKKKYTMDDLRRERQKLEKQIEKEHYPYPLARDRRALQKNLRMMLRHFVWAKGDVLWNDPEQMKLARDKQSSTMITVLYERIDRLHKDLRIESAYFIPRGDGLRHLIELRKKGIKVSILTNSLKSNDVAAAYAGYENYRKRLLGQGIEIYELRSDAGANKIINQVPVKTDVSTGLHSKIMVFDEQDLFVGSFNLDPRSSGINTEGGLYVESPTLAKRVISYMNEGIKPENSYRLELDRSGNIVWITTENGKRAVYTSEPKVGMWDRVKVNLLQMLPFEDQL